MAYWLDDGFDTWPETVRAGKAAAGLYVCCGAWIARSIGNGTATEPVVPAEIATMYGTPEWVAKLVAVGLWAVEGHGYRDVRYHAMGNPDAATVVKRKAAAAERQRRFRGRVTRDKTRDSRTSNAGSHDSPALPSSPKGEGRAARLRTVPDWCGRCNKDNRLTADDEDRTIRCPRCHPERRVS